MLSNVRARSSPAALWTIRAVTLAAFLDLYMQLPVISTYAKSLGAADGGLAGVGAIVGMYSAINLLGNVGAGVALDRIDRKLLVIAGMLLTAAALYCYPLVQTPEQLLALRGVHGFAAGALAPGAFAMLGDRSGDSGQARSMGMGGALIAVAAVIGPALAGIIGDRWGYAYVFMTSGSFMLVAAAAFWLLVPGDAKVAAPPSAPSAPSGDAPDVERTKAESPLRNPAMLKVYGATLAMTYGFGALVAYLPIMLEATGASARLSGYALSTMALVGAAVMASPIQRGLDSRSRPLTVIVGLAGMGASCLVLATSAGALPGVFAGMLLFGFGFGLLFPALTATVSESADGRRRGAAFGIFYAVYSLGVVIGSVITGQASEALAALGAPFYVAGVVPLLAIPLALGIQGRKGV